jgi:hypothetical protein
MRKSLKYMVFCMPTTSTPLAGGTTDVVALQG